MRKRLSSNGGRAVIIIPHVDDDFYSCWSIMSDTTYDRVEVVRCSTNKNQETRAKIYTDLMTDPKYDGWVNKNLVVTKLMDKLPQDGNMSLTPMRDMITALDKIFTTGDKIEHLFIPAISHHQDHEYLSKCCMAALRYRSSLIVESVFKYTYMYHNPGEDSCVYKPMTKLQSNHRSYILNKMNEYDNILSGDSVNSTKFLRSNDISNGLQINRQAAEKFIPVRVII